MKVFSLRDPRVVNTEIPDSISKLKKLRYFEIAFSQDIQHIAFNAMTKWQELRYIALHIVPQVDSYIPPQFWKLPYLNTVIMEYCDLNETIFNPNNFVGYSNSISRVALDGNSLICDGTIWIDNVEYFGFEYLAQFYNNEYGRGFNTSTMNDTDGLNENLIKLVQFIATYDPCFAPCSAGESASYWGCLGHEWRDGRCNGGCDIAECNFDGGDCNQFCDFGECSMNMLLNDTCDLQCNNTQCGFDFLACVGTLQDVNGTCYVGNISNYSYNSYSRYNSSNYSELEEMEEFEICYNEWSVDTWCDSNCNRTECNNDNDYCSPNSCQSDENCHVAYQTIIQTVASQREPDELIMMDDVCGFWVLLGSIIDTSSYSNCTHFFQTYDINKNGFLGFHEAIRATAIYFNLDTSVDWHVKLEQIDCSHCMQNSSLWDW